MTNTATTRESAHTDSRQAGSLADAAIHYKAAQGELLYRREKLRQAVNAAIHAGMTETEAAWLAGVTRMTVRSWRGKGKADGSA